MALGQATFESLTRMRSQQLAFTVTATLAFVGCGAEQQVDPNRTVVSGVVTFDGKPLRGGTISFTSETGAGTSIAIDEGNYATNRVPIGKNTITIQTESLRFGSPALYVPIPAKYGDPTKSGLEADIKAGVNENINFDLKK